jgi:hypothetical protein
MSRDWRKAEIQFAGVFALIGLLVWFAEGPAKYATIKPLVGLGFLVLAVALVVVSFLGADPLTRDLRDGRVLAADGAIRKWTTTTHGRSSSITSHYAEAGGMTVETGQKTYDALPWAGIVRLFYLPHSRKLVNFEELADRPVPADALTNPRVLLKDAALGVLGSADARAELAAVGHETEAQMHGSLTPPPASQTLPLRENLAGSWSNAMVKATFGQDGSLEMELARGLKRSGRWSIDSSGRLVSDITGSQATAQAWIVGDALTVTFDGEGITPTDPRDRGKDHPQLNQLT